jgi:hypothetical protein
MSDMINIVIDWIGKIRWKDRRNRTRRSIGHAASQFASSLFDEFWKMKPWAVDRAEWEGWSTPAKDGKPKPTNEKVTRTKINKPNSLVAIISNRLKAYICKFGWGKKEKSFVDDRILG